jgi:hypothetical protein
MAGLVALLGRAGGQGNPADGDHDVGRVDV